jgi:hypothetical protein
VRETADIAAGRHTREADSRQWLDEGMLRTADANAGPVAIMPVAVPPAPAPLLDHLALPVLPAPGSIRPAVADRSKASSDPESTEVHVHIGRIEVTALPAPAAPKQRERPVRQSVPLSDYLAKRRSS